ncbi:hypothetical protein BX666DRAFT_2004413 [Dichotomocladium elegans]|nr:hypothetical protein BX666DRAFT_2004413 [Dichotomocladium elegans]
MQPEPHLIHLMSNEHQHHPLIGSSPTSSVATAGVGGVTGPSVVGGSDHFSLTTKHIPVIPSTTPSKVLFDFLLHKSIQSRLAQGALELEELEVHPAAPKRPLETRQSEWLEAAYKAEKDKHAVEAIIPGILSVGSKVNTPSFAVDYESRQRLHLCQLSTIVFGRFDHSSSVIAPHTPTHMHRRAAEACFCRRHRQQACVTCKDIHTHKKSGSVNGLVEAIPIFLRVSADLLRRTLDTTSDARPMIFTGQRVMGGGMPPRWYDLFLELLTQAAIERYLCDGQIGQEVIFEIFSYGEVEDEDEPDETDDDDEHEYHSDENELGEDYWGVRAADHHLLFPKTRTMYLFKTQVLKREREVKRLNISRIYGRLTRTHALSLFAAFNGQWTRITD